MWYKYVNRAGYDAARIWRYNYFYVVVATSSTIRTTMVSPKLKPHLFGKSISSELLAVKAL